MLARSAVLSAVVSVVLLGGCSSYVNVKSLLVTQASGAIDAIEVSTIERSRMLDESSKLERRRLDAAFDLDVRQRGALDSNWVIEHRKAYALGLDALNSESSARRAALTIDQDNAESARQALALLERIHQIESGSIFTGKIHD